MDERAGQRNLLLHAARISLDPLAATVPEAEPLKQRLRVVLRRFRIERPKAGDEFQVLHGVEFTVENGVVGQVGELLLGATRLGNHVDAVDFDLPGVPAG